MACRKNNSQIREILFQKTNGCCGYCGKNLNRRFTVDHIIPKSRFKKIIRTQRETIHPDLAHLTIGDINHIDNKMAACEICNKNKSDSTIEEFRERLQLITKSIRNSNNLYQLGKRFGTIIENNSPIIFYFEKIN